MNGLELGKKALKLFREVRGSESLNDQCQRLSGYYTQWAYQGHERGIIVYPSANAAWAAAPKNGTKINECPVGGFFYWRVGKYGHVGMCIGYDGKRALVLHTAQGGDTVLKLDPSLKVSHADTYPQVFRNWSYTNGANPRMKVSAWPEVLKVTDRVVGANGVHGRLDPNTSRPSQGLLKPGTVVPMESFTREGQNVGGNSVWFKAANGMWFWSGGFAGASMTGLVDITPPPVVIPEPEPKPEPPVVVDPEPVEPAPDPVDPDPVDPTPEPTSPAEPPFPEPIPVEPGEPEPPTQHAGETPGWFVLFLRTLIEAVIKFLTPRSKE